MKYEIASNLVGTLEADTVKTVLEMGVPIMSAEGKVKYEPVLAATGVNYNRGWLLIRYAWLAANQPQALVDMHAASLEAEQRQNGIVKDLEAQLRKATDAKEVARLEAVIENARFDVDRHHIGAVAASLRAQNLSWGEISVRMNTPEATIRRCFNKVSATKDRGLRIGRGGRFAYDDPILYLENRRKEGAHIPVDYKMRPKPEDLLNFHPKEEVKPTKAPAKRTAAKKAAPATKSQAPAGSRPAKRAAKVA